MQSATAISQLLSGAYCFTSTTNTMPGLGCSSQHVANTM